MRGTTKWFDTKKGYGFLTDSEGNDIFVHYSSINIDGHKQLSEGDIVEFEVGQGTTDREQAVNVHPILTRNMVNKALRKEDLHLKTTKDALGNKAYMVVDANNVIQAGENGMSLVQSASYAGIDTEGLE